MWDTIEEEPSEIEAAMKATTQADKKKELQERMEQEKEDKVRGCGPWINEDGTTSNDDVLINDTVPVDNKQRRVTLNVETPHGRGDNREHKEGELRWP